MRCNAIGGGVTGTSVLFQLTRLGCRNALLLERDDLAVQAAHWLPAFRDCQLMRSWSGLYGATPDWNPVLGQVPGIEGLHVAFGFSGHGFKLSPMLGRILGQSLFGLDADLPIEPCRMTRFAEGALLLGAYGPGAAS